MRKLKGNEYKQIILSVMCKIDKICRENHLKYMIMYGTLIGAIRHKGFIPWDDDIDIVMPRKDYYTLSQIISNGNYGINFISVETNQDTIFPFGKICDTRTRLIEKNFKPVKDYGAYVDVFPLDYMPDDYVERKKYCKECRRLRVWIIRSARIGYNDTNDSLKTKILKFIKLQIFKRLSTEKYVRMLNEKLITFNKNHLKTSYYGVPYEIRAEELFPAELFDEIIEVSFEGYRFFAPKEYDKILTLQYGNYMILPPESERITLHQLDCCIKD